MRKVKFEVPGDPKGKGRPRFSRNGRPYTPQGTIVYENLVRLEYERQANGVFFEKDIPLMMRIMAYYSIPKSAGKGKRNGMLLGEIRPTKKPDSSNVLKAIEDALNSVAYYDDSQIVSTTIDRYYGENPRVEVVISELLSNGAERRMDGE